MSFLFGNNRQKQKEDLDNEYYKRQKAFNQAKNEQRERNARAAGIEAANREANHKPFYKKLMGAGMAIAKDLATGDPNDMMPFGKGSKNQRQSQSTSNPFFSFNEPQTRRVRKKKRKRR